MGMGIDVLNERLFSLDDFGKKIPRRRCRATIEKWIKTGAKYSRFTPERIKLEAVIIGGVLHTSLEAYERWVQKLTEEAKKLENY